MNGLTFYIDESCHLEHDNSPIMCVGAIKVPDESIVQYKEDIKAIKRKYGILHEIKWNTISNTHVDMYKELIDYFFSSRMDFRCVLVSYKDRLDNASFNHGDHDNFYYKMIYFLLYNPYAYDYSGLTQYRVFLDIKDTRGRHKLDKIHQVFDNKFLGKSPFLQFQHIRSHESQFIQLTDLFIGAIAYKSRSMGDEPNASPAKKEIINYLEAKSGYTLNEGTEPSEHKFNIFNHQPRKK
ncbi:MAG: DUF3800 domain-containing protein [Bacteroidales bacterium]|nr:DUF3800 domain-containing protein [Bacteroidales bacterium]